MEKEKDRISAKNALRVRLVEMLKQKVFSPSKNPTKTQTPVSNKRK